MFSEYNTIEQIENHVFLSPLKGFLLNEKEIVVPGQKQKPLGAFAMQGLDTRDLINGMNHLLSSVKANGLHLIKKNDEVNMVYLSSTRGRPGMPWVILCAGGGYRNVCSFGESYPVAAVLNSLGFDCFVLTYRTTGPALMPKPLDDLCWAVQQAMAFMNGRNSYVVCGFSAGGNLASLWGTPNKGARHYDVPSPCALFLVYPQVSTKVGFERETTREKLHERLFGENAGLKILEDYDVPTHIDPLYPPAYLVHCRDDDKVPFINSLVMRAKMESQGVLVQLDEGERGGHGFGVGSGTDVAGWVNHAVSWLEALV